MVRFSKEVFARANRFISQNNIKLMLLHVSRTTNLSRLCRRNTTKRRPLATATKAFAGYSVGNFPRRHPEERQPRLKETAPGDLMPESDERISGAPVPSR